MPRSIEFVSAKNVDLGLPVRRSDTHDTIENDDYALFPMAHLDPLPIVNGFSHKTVGFGSKIGYFHAFTRI